MDLNGYLFYRHYANVLLIMKQIQMKGKKKAVLKITGNEINYQLDTKLAALPCNKLLHTLWKHNNFTVYISGGVGTKDKKVLQRNPKLNSGNS